MNKKEVLELLQELINQASYCIDSPDSYYSNSVVDHEQLMKNIEKALEKEDRDERDKNL